MNDNPSVSLLEEVSLNAYPGAGQMHYDGWALLLSPGRWRRANSVQIMHPSSRPLDEKIAYCEAFYGSRSKRTIFKLTRESAPALEPLLAARGYDYDAETSVKAMALPAAGPFDSYTGVTAQIGVTDAYAEAFYRIHHFEDADRAPWKVIQRNILPLMGYLGLWVGGEMIASAIGVVERGWLGVYGVGTLPAFQRQGYALHIMRALMAWGIERGATHSYLQVMRNNPAALALYERLDYHEAYRYWYRQK
ncbi:MAG: GNAT family N-acetyltransferase [Anaerolineae bacterium]|nr:GNAT family N-acetyltransferase [Anaerolineae bacterium]